jgi:hypothetical protein
VAAYVFRMRSLPAPPPSPTPVQDDVETQISHPAESAGSSLLVDAPIIGKLRALTDVEKISTPPVGISLGRRPGEADDPDLSTPAVAVYEVLALIDRGATDRLGPCFVPGAQDLTSGLYPRYLGPPIEVVEVAEEGDRARVYWNATVHTGFTLEGKKRSPGETVRLETRLVHIDGVWKLAQLHEDSP